MYIRLPYAKLRSITRPSIPRRQDDARLICFNEDRLAKHRVNRSTLHNKYFIRPFFSSRRISRNDSFSSNPYERAVYTMNLEICFPSTHNQSAYIIACFARTSNCFRRRLLSTILGDDSPVKRRKDCTGDADRQICKRRGFCVPGVIHASPNASLPSVQ